MRFFNNDLNTITRRSYLPDNFINGVVLSLDTDTDHDLNITACQCIDSANAYDMTLPTEMTKQIDATWAAGDDAGGDFVTSGTPTADATYYFFLIRKDSDGSIDAGFDTSSIAANIPTGYTAYRQVGHVTTDSSSNIQNIHYYVNADTIRGTWLPTLQDTSYSDAESQTYTFQVGTYIKIGNHVQIIGYLAMSSLGTLTTGSVAAIGNLPYSSVTSITGTNAGNVSMGLASNLAIAATASVSGWVIQNSTRINLQLWDASGGTTGLLISEVSANGAMGFSGQYVTD